MLVYNSLFDALMLADVLLGEDTTCSNSYAPPFSLFSLSTNGYLAMREVQNALRFEVNRFSEQNALLTATISRLEENVERQVLSTGTSAPLFSTQCETISFQLEKSISFLTSGRPAFLFISLT